MHFLGRMELPKHLVLKECSFVNTAMQLILTSSTRTEAFYLVPSSPAHLITTLLVSDLYRAQCFLIIWVKIMKKHAEHSVQRILTQLCSMNQKNIRTSEAQLV